MKPDRTGRSAFSGFGPALAGLLALVVASGCGGPNQGAQPKPPEPYRLSGRVVDAATGRPIPQARLRFQAVLNTLLGPRSIKMLDIAGIDGTYLLQIPAGYDMMRAANQIRIDAAQVGYTVAGVDLPAPSEKKKVYAVPDIALSKAKPKSPWSNPPPGPAKPDEKSTP